MWCDNTCMCHHYYDGLEERTSKMRGHRKKKDGMHEKECNDEGKIWGMSGVVVGRKEWSDGGRERMK